MGQDFQNFMRILLTDEPGEPTLFEPFIHTRIAEQLIWRRGEHLWNTPETYIDTLIALNNCTNGDVVIADTRKFGSDPTPLYRAMVARTSDTLRFVCICDTRTAAEQADRCGAVCAVGVYGNIRSRKPMIKMDGCLGDAIKGGYAGWYAPRRAEDYWNESCDSIAILGGLGADYVASTGPASIHRRCEGLYRLTDNRRYALGSGGCLSDGHYLELISLLGIYKRYKF